MSHRESIMAGMYRIIFRRIRLRKVRRRKRPGTQKYLLHKDATLAIVTARLEHFNRFYGLSYNRVTIRNQKGRWGSCSSKRNLNFNYRIVFLTPEQQDYIVVHELCHLAHMNHGPEFWALVEKQVPEWKKLRKSLKNLKI